MLDLLPLSREALALLVLGSLPSFPISIGYRCVEIMAHTIHGAAGWALAKHSCTYTCSSQNLLHVCHEVRVFRKHCSTAHSLFFFPLQHMGVFCVHFCLLSPSYFLLTEKIGPQVNEGAKRLKGEGTI